MSAKINSLIEIDFFAQTGFKLLTIEVKAEENVRSNSLRQFITVDNADSDLKGYRFSMKGFQSPSSAGVAEGEVGDALHKFVEERK